MRGKVVNCENMGTVHGHRPEYNIKEVVGNEKTIVGEDFKEYVHALVGCLLL